MEMYVKGCERYLFHFVIQHFTTTTTATTTTTTTATTATTTPATPAATTTTTTTTIVQYRVFFKEYVHIYIYPGSPTTIFYRLVSEPPLF